VQVASFGSTTLDMSDLPTRHPYTLGLRQNEIERIMAQWLTELPVRMLRRREVVGFAQDEDGVDVRHAPEGVHALGRLQDGRTVRVVLSERRLETDPDPPLADLSASWSTQRRGASASSGWG
jgi:hypothetical protein